MKKVLLIVVGVACIILAATLVRFEHQRYRHDRRHDLNEYLVLVDYHKTPKQIAPNVWMDGDFEPGVLTKQPRSSGTSVIRVALLPMTVGLEIPSPHDAWDLYAAIILQSEHISAADGLALVQFFMQLGAWESEVNIRAENPLDPSMEIGEHSPWHQQFIDLRQPLSRVRTILGDFAYARNGR